MLNKKKDGKTLKFTAAANIAGGSIHKVGDAVGVVVNSVKSGEEGLLDLEGGIYEVNTTNAIGQKAQGTALYVASVPSTGADLTSVSTDAIKVGQLEEATPATQKTIRIRIPRAG